MTMETVRTHVLEQHGIVILCVADVRGNLSLFNELADQYHPDVIIHTGNFGFLDSESIERIHESYLRHIVEFSPLLSPDLILKISELSKVSGDAVQHLSNDNMNLKTLLQGQDISELSKFLSGELKLNVPVYAIYGMCEDSYVINKFRYGEYSIPNLYIIDDSKLHVVQIKDQPILLSGIGGSLSYHKLFHQGTTHGAHRSNEIIPISGDPGNIWITMLQLGKLMDSLVRYSQEYPHMYNKAIKFFVTHQSPTREPLLEHLSIFFKMDYTISNSLHFKYISSYNALTVSLSFESYKLKFAEARTKLAKIWGKVQKKYERLLLQLPQLMSYIDLALCIYDKIPTKPLDDLPLLALSPTVKESLEVETPLQSLNSVIRHLNDLYYVSFQHAWHYNICDVGCGSLILELDNGTMKMNAISKGFNFSFRKE